MTIWAFLAPREAAKRLAIYDSLRNEGKSRFGWSTEDANNLTLERNHWTDANREQMFLLKIEQGDWIVHVNVPKHNRCVAAKVLSGYNFDDGLRFSDHTDLRHCFEIAITELVEFGRRDPAVVPSVNLDPWRRFHRVKATVDFHRTLDNVRTGKTANLWSETGPILDKLTKLIHDYNRSKKLEAFLARVFRRMPGVTDVEEPGQAGGSDYGTDLIVHYKIPPLPNAILIVQVKSYKDSHTSTHAIEQIKTGISKYRLPPEVGGTAGLIVTTADEIDPRVLEAIEAAKKSLGVPIELLASDDVAKFVIRYAPDELFEGLPD